MEQAIGAAVCSFPAEVLTFSPSFASAVASEWFSDEEPSQCSLVPC